MLCLFLFFFSIFRYHRNRRRRHRRLKIFLRPFLLVFFFALHSVLNMNFLCSKHLSVGIFDFLVCVRFLFHSLFHRRILYIYLFFLCPSSFTSFSFIVDGLCRFLYLFLHHVSFLLRIIYPV